MDNQNNSSQIPNWPPLPPTPTPDPVQPAPTFPPAANPSPFPSNAWPTDTLPTTPPAADPNPVWTPPSPQPLPNTPPATWPSQPAEQPASPNIWPTPVQPNPVTTTTDNTLPPTNTWMPPTNPQSLTPQPEQIPTQTEPVSPWTPPTQIPQPEPVLPEPGPPMPTFTPSTQPAEPVASPLDNPWGAPSQPPSIDGSQTSIQPSWALPSTPSPAPTDSTPTDLSHLITNNAPQESTIATPETLAVPPQAINPEVPTMQTSPHKGFPKWLFGLGLGLLVTVLGVSAYFILGVGQPVKTTSLPAVTAPSNAETEPLPPAASPVTQPPEEPAAPGSDNFGTLGGGTSGDTQATSAAELLRQRQQQER